MPMLETAGLTHPGKVRSNNEDCYLISPDLGLYAIADGIGGARAGEHASRLAIDTVSAFVSRFAQRYDGILVDAFVEAHRQVRAAAEADPSLNGMGTTLVAALQSGDGFRLASVGDSRAYLNETKQLNLITSDQTWVAEFGRPAGISEDELKRHPLRHVLTMAVGADVELRVNAYSVEIAHGSQLLLSTDGLHGVVDEEIILETLNSGQTLEAKAHYLVEAALRAGGPDNITVVLLRAV